MTTIYVIGFILSAFGLYLIGLDLVHAPDRRMLRTARLIRKRARPPETTRTGRTLKKLASRIRLPGFLRQRLENTLRSCGSDESPESFAARTVLPPALLSLGGLLLFGLSPFIGILLLVGAGLAFWVGARRPSQLRKRRREAVERELPWLVFTIARRLERDRDVFSMLAQARPAMGPVMREELDRTLSDMQSAHPEAALLRWEKRIGSADLSAVVRGLVAVLDGDDTRAYWVMTSEKMGENARQTLREQAAKVPKKVRRVSLCILICFLLCYAVVIGGVLMGSLGGLFG